MLDDTSVARTQQALLRAYEADQKAYEELEKLRASENPAPEAISTAEQAADDAHWAAQQAEYDRNSALASYQEMQRQNNLSAQVNQASAEDVALDIKDTQAEIEQLEQLVNQQGVISSPFSGVISNVEAEVGTESTQTFCTIYDTSKGYLFACELPAAQASDCQTGLSAVIKQGDQTETAAITAISENAENDTVDITIQLTATDWKVGPADAEIVLSEQDYDLCLPNTAIHQDNQGDFVFAVEEKNTVLGTQNVLVRIPVTVLEVGQSQTSIEGAISPEDSIVVQSTRSLEAGSKVRVKNHCNGCCVPGSRKLYVKANGDLLICERIGSSPIIGNIFTGIDKTLLSEKYDTEYVARSLPACKNCWAVNLCPICYANCYTEDGIDPAEKASNCNGVRSQLERCFSMFYELLEENPSALDALKETTRSS